MLYGFMSTEEREEYPDNKMSCSERIVFAIIMIIIMTIAAIITLKITSIMWQ